VADSYFSCLAEDAATGRYAAGPATEGPWAPQLQHGGPPNALAVRAAERVVRAETGRDDLVALRLAADFVGPVPVAEVETRARVVRAARSAALAEVTVSAGGRDCLLGRVWFVRDADTAGVAAPPGLPVAVPDERSTLDFRFGYGASLDWRFVHGRMARPGPATAWVRPTLPLVDDYEWSGLARVALIADSASGISAELDWATWSFLNVDLDIHLARPVEGEWVLMDAASQLGAHGSALARSTLSDARGVVGSSLQTLILAPIRSAP
jgi:hypothetical protein